MAAERAGAETRRTASDTAAPTGLGDDRRGGARTLDSVRTPPTLGATRCTEVARPPPGRPGRRGSDYARGRRASRHRSSIRPGSWPSVSVSIAWRARWHPGGRRVLVEAQAHAGASSALPFRRRRRRRPGRPETVVTARSRPAVEGPAPPAARPGARHLGDESLGRRANLLAPRPQSPCRAARTSSSTDTTGWPCTSKVRLLSSPVQRNGTS